MIKKTLLISFCLINLNSIGYTSEEDGSNPLLNGVKVVSGPDTSDSRVVLLEVDREEFNESRSERIKKWEGKIEGFKKTHKRYWASSPQRKKQIESMKKNGIFIEPELKGSANIELSTEQIIERKEVLKEIINWLENLEDEFQEDDALPRLNPILMRESFVDSYNAWNSLEAWEEKFKEEEDLNKKLGILNLKRYLSCPGFHLRKQAIEKAKKKDAPVPVHHHLTTTSNLKRDEKVIIDADALLWRAYAFSGHRYAAIEREKSKNREEMLERNVAIERERAERAEAENEILRNLLNAR